MYKKLLFLLYLISTTVFAQNSGSITGNVIHKNGEGIPQASVEIMGTDIGTETDC